MHRYGLHDQLVVVIEHADDRLVDDEIADVERIVDLGQRRQIHFDRVWHVLREGLDVHVVAGMDEDRAERLHRGRLVHEVQRHLCVRLLGEAHALEVDMKEAAGERVTCDAVDQRGDRVAIEALER